jgi:hypothetical protein
MIQIIDNLTTPANNQQLYKLLLEHPWFFLENTAYNQARPAMQKYENSWTHFLYNDNETLSPLKDLAESVLITALYKLNIPCSKLVRIRAGLSTRTPYPVMHSPHVDWDSEHYTGLYYLNTSDGDTVFYNEQWEPTIGMQSVEWVEQNKLSEKQRVSPVADRFVAFNGLNFHSSTTPCETDHRIILNFNWLP